MEYSGGDLASAETWLAPRILFGDFGLYRLQRVSAIVTKGMVRSADTRFRVTKFFRGENRCPQCDGGNSTANDVCSAMRRI